MKREREGELFVVILCLLESWFPILALFAIPVIGALYSYALVITVATAVLICILIWKKQLHLLLLPEAQKDLLLTSFFITLLFVLIFLGLQYTTAGNMAVIIFLQLLFSYLYFNVFGSEKMTLLHTWGALLMGIGAVVVLFPEELTLNRGDWLILPAAAVAPVANLYQKRARRYVSSMTILTYRNLAALPFVSLLAWSLEPQPGLQTLQGALPYIIAIALLVYVAAKILWVEALHRISITKVSALTAVLPIFTLFFAYIVLNEVPSIRQLAGILPILVGGYLITRPEPSQAT
ncbi:MAG: DMT family transporter [Sulfurimonadaceae bacterium]|nr:DMT family transporter [Sulfurimonadaceae bacterium]